MEGTYVFAEDVTARADERDVAVGRLLFFGFGGKARISLSAFGSHRKATMMLFVVFESIFTLEVGVGTFGRKDREVRTVVGVSTILFPLVRGASV